MIRIAHEHRPTGWRLLIAPLLVFTAVGALAVPYPQLLGNGEDLVQLTLGAQLAAPALVALLFLKPIATAGSLGSGASGGLFMPTIATGALFGSVARRGWTHPWPGSAAGFEVIGAAAAVLAVAMQAPVAAVVLMLELTRTIDAVTGAMLVSRTLDTFYSVRLPPSDLKRVAALMLPGPGVSETGMPVVRVRSGVVRSPSGELPRTSDCGRGRAERYCSGRSPPSWTPPRPPVRRRSPGPISRAGTRSAGAQTLELTFAGRRRDGVARCVRGFDAEESAGARGAFRRR